MTNEEKLKRAFQTSLDLPDNTDFKIIEFAKTSGWDSIAHFQLVAAIEQEFGFVMNTSDILAMSNFEKALSIVKKYV